MSEKNRLQEYCQKNKLSMPIYKSWSNGEQHCLQWSSSVTIKINDKDITIDTIVPCKSKISSEKQAAIMMLNHIESGKNDNNNNNNNPISQISKLRQLTKLSIISTHKTLSPNKPNIQDEDDDPSNDFSETNKNNNEDESLNDFFESDKNDNEFIEPDKNDGEKKFLENFDNIYLIDLENKPIFKLKTKSNSLYIGFLNSLHHSIIKYKQWHICKSDNIIMELSSSQNNKLLYLIEGGTSNLVDHFMTCFSYPVVNYISVSNISPTIFIISGDHAGWCTRICLEEILKWKKIKNIEIKNSPSI